LSLKVLTESGYRRLYFDINWLYSTVNVCRIAVGFNTAFSLQKRPERFRRPHRPTSEQGYLSFFGAREFFEILVKTRGPYLKKSIKMHKIEIARFIKGVLISP
jgi:hypothetical protein